MHNVQAVDASRHQLGQLDLLTDRVQTVGVDTADDHRHLAAAQRCLDAAATAADVVVVEDLREHHVAAGIEPLDQLVGLVFEVALDGVTATLEWILLSLGRIREALVQLEFVAVVHVRNAPRNSQSRGRPAARAVIVAALPVGIGLDGGDLGGLGADLVRGGPGAHSQDECTAHSFGVADHPLERPRAAHGSTEDRCDGVDLEGVHQCDLGPHLVEHGDLREA